MSKRTLLLGVAGLLTASALFAIAVLLFGHFGSTEGRILGTTAMLAGYGILALPATFLLDLGRARPLAFALAGVATLAAGVSAVTIWWEDPPIGFPRTAATGAALTVALTQTCALVARRRDGDPRSVRRLFLLSLVTASIAAVMISYLTWTERGGPGFGRIFGSVVILDLLAVALQPILARARPDIPTHHLVLTLVGGDVVAMHIEAPDLAGAAAKAIRAVERDGKSVATVAIGAGAPEVPQTALSGRTSSSGV